MMEFSDKIAKAGDGPGLVRLNNHTIVIYRTVFITFPDFYQFFLLDITQYFQTWSLKISQYYTDSSCLSNNMQYGLELHWTNIYPETRDASHSQYN